MFAVVRTKLYIYVLILVDYKRSCYLTNIILQSTV
jgi:hypothetical protein